MSIAVEELEGLYGGPESERVERKPSLAQSKEIRRTLCAFANDLPGQGRPGVLFVGVRDSGACAGLTIDDELLQKLANFRGDGTLLPMPAMRVTEGRFDGCHVAVVIVEPVAAPPVRLSGRAYVRVGPTTRVATPDEERILAERRRAQDLPFDLQPAPGAKLEDLDLDFFRREYLRAAVSVDTLERNQRTNEEQMRSLRLATGDGPSLRPTVLAVLLLGADPRRSVPGGYVQFLRIAGTSLTDPIKDQKELDGPLPELLRKLDQLLELNISVATDIAAETEEVQYPDYPVGALRQFTRNAVMHRNYEGTGSPARIYWFSDRIEIQSPGGPYGQVNRDNFGRPGVTDYRNPHLAEAMKNLGYVQRFGVGIPVAQRELSENGNPPAEFVVEENHVLVVVRERS